MFNDSTVTKEKQQAYFKVLCGGLVMVFISIFTEDNLNHKIIDHILEGYHVTSEINSKTSAVLNKNIRFKIDKRTKSCSINSIGEIVIDLVKDFSLSGFEKKIDSEVEFPVIETGNIEVRSQSFWTENINLKSLDSTKKYFEIVADEIQVYDSPGSSGKKLGVGKKTEKYEVLDTSSSSWTKVNFKGINGWIPIVAGNYIWIPSLPTLESDSYGEFDQKKIQINVNNNKSTEQILNKSLSQKSKIVKPTSSANNYMNKVKNKSLSQKSKIVKPISTDSNFRIKEESELNYLEKYFPEEVKQLRNRLYLLKDVFETTSSDTNRQTQQMVEDAKIRYEISKLRSKLK